MYLKEIDVWRVDTAKGGFDGVEDALAGEAALVHVIDGLIDVLEGQRFRVVAFPDGSTAFGKEDELMARDVVFLDGFADNFFRGAVAVNICRVPLGDAFERPSI